MLTTTELTLPTQLVFSKCLEIGKRGLSRLSEKPGSGVERRNSLTSVSNILNDIFAHRGDGEREGEGEGEKGEGDESALEITKHIELSHMKI